jgi:hypothetical protein
VLHFKLHQRAYQKFALKPTWSSPLLHHSSNKLAAPTEIVVESDNEETLRMLDARIECLERISAYLVNHKLAIFGTVRGTLFAVLVLLCNLAFVIGFTAWQTSLCTPNMGFIDGISRDGRPAPRGGALLFVLGPSLHLVGPGGSGCSPYRDARGGPISPTCFFNNEGG